jgi:hypothetical protein
VLVLQPFAFYEAQFFASAGLVLSLPILALVQYALRREAGDAAGLASVAPTPETLAAGAGGSK